MHDELGSRMKKQYEHRTRYFLPRRTYTIVRLDGKAFHTFTKGFKRPFDTVFMDMMNETAAHLCNNIQGCKFAYVQSDEISLLLTDMETATTDAYFDGNIQKIASITASMATVAFNACYWGRMLANESDENKRKIDEAALAANCLKGAMFDSRVFTIPDKEEVVNYFIWRQQDAVRNSIQMVAQSLYSHKELHKKNQSQLQDMIHDKGQNWNDFPIGSKRGRVVTKQFFKKEGATRSRWIIEGPPIFTQYKNYIYNKIYGKYETKE